VPKLQISIPEPNADVASLLLTCKALKEAVETLSGQRGSPADVAVRFGDLIENGVLQPEQLPRELGPYRP
jgi:hypothetical protein